MRRPLIFLIALALGSVAVIGQDDPDRELKSRIAELTALLEARAEQREAADPGRPVLRVYEIGDLCSPVLDERMEVTNLRPSDYQPPEPNETASVRGPYEVDFLIEIVRQTVLPSTWDTIEGADIQPKGTRLFVHQIPRVHERIATLLGHLRTFVDAQVMIEIVAVPLGPEHRALLERRPRELEASEAQQLLALEPLGSARLTCFDGQQTVQRNGRRRPYLADYDVKLAEKAAMGFPIRANLFDGCAVEVRATLDRGGDGVVLICRIDRTEVEEPVRELVTAHGLLELPTMELTRLRTALWAPLGRTIVAGVGSVGDRSCAILLTARKVTSGESK